MAFLTREPPEGDDSWQPRVDVYKARDGWVIKVDVAGVKIEDVSIRVSGSNVEITGVRRDLTVDRGWNCYAMEIAYNRFRRTVELPCELESVELSSDYQEGMLLIHLLCEVNQR